MYNIYFLVYKKFEILALFYYHNSDICTFHSLIMMKK